ncbi:DNA internalization-related competence protein ComEC/Rec2 [bacterium]|nr:DNA internalization-related competence protein ComEC/Rec2 [bacterium]
MNAKTRICANEKRTRIVANKEKRARLPLPVRQAGTKQEYSRIRYPLVAIVLVYILGIILGHLLDLSLPSLLSILAFLLILFFLAFWRKKPTISTLLLGILLLLTGLLYHDITLKRITKGEIASFLNKGWVEVLGTIDQLSEVKKDRIHLIVKTEKILSRKKEFPVKSRIRVSLPKAKASFNYGEKVRIRGGLIPPPGARNPGGFSYQNYLATQKISALVNLVVNEQIKKVGEARVNPFFRIVFYLRKHLIKTIDDTLPSLEGSVLKGIILGRREELPSPLRQAFITTGVAHVLAVSGLHVGLVAAFFHYGLFRLLRLPNKGSALLTLLIIILYCFMTGCRPPVVRATIMFGLFLTASCLGRKREVYTTLALAALVILLINPLTLFNVGFQLSFAAVLSILYLYPRIWPRLKFLSSYPAGLISVSLAAWMGVAPLIAYHFNYFTPVAILANLVVVSLVMVVVALGFLTTIFSFFFPLAQLFSSCNWLFLTILIKAIHLFSHFPGAGIRVVTPSLSLIGLYYLGIVGIVNFRRSLLVRKVVSMGALCLTAIFIWGNIFISQDKLLKVTFLDVGQGDSIFIQFPDRKSMLIDGGDGRFDILPSYLWDEGIRRIDYLVLSHPHADHVTGLINVLFSFKIGEVWDSGQEFTSPEYEKFLRIIDDRRISYKIVRAGQRLDITPRIKINILHPQERFLKGGGSEPNNNSIVMKLSYGEVNFLFTGDIEKEAEELLEIRYGDQLPSTILKAPHQGSRTSSTLKFLKKTSPECAIISVGANNLFGHPHPEVLKRYQKLEIKRYRTDENGAITITTDGKDYWVKTMQKDRD